MLYLQNLLWNNITSSCWGYVIGAKSPTQDNQSPGNSFTTKKQMTKFSSANFQKICNPSYISYWEFKDHRANSVDLDEVAHDEPPHQDLYCLQIQLFWSVLVKELMVHWTTSYSRFHMLDNNALSKKFTMKQNYKFMLRLCNRCKKSCWG